MNVTIYGKPGCPYCLLAKKHAEQLPDAEVSYIDIERENISRTYLETLVGRAVRTLPQILINSHPVGGYNEFARLTTGA